MTPGVVASLVVIGLLIAVIAELDVCRQRRKRTFKVPEDIQ